MSSEASNDDLSRLLLTALKSVLEPKSAVYAAGPLDTGKLYFEAIASGTHDPSIRIRNQAALSAFVAAIREKVRPAPVIDPGLLQVEKWTPREIGVLFLESITLFAKEAWFIDGWEYSTGATKEYLHCVSIGTPCFTQSGMPLSMDLACSLLTKAIDFIASIGLDAAKLRERLNAFKAI